jgi:hypothetical protein
MVLRVGVVTVDGIDDGRMWGHRGLIISEDGGGGAIDVRNGAIGVCVCVCTLSPSCLSFLFVLSPLFFLSSNL